MDNTQSTFERQAIACRRNQSFTLSSFGPASALLSDHLEIASTALEARHG